MIIKLTDQYEEEMIRTIQELIKIKSYSGREKKAIKFLEKKMLALDFDEVKIDEMGNLIGRVGDGRKTILFDSHVDTVEAENPEEWDYPPFSGAIDDGMIYGRGAVDMKSSAVISIYAASLAKELKLLEGKKIYVTCTLSEEDCDGENLKHLFKEFDLKPDYFITCEPSGNKIVTGHNGKAQISIKTKGISAHGSAPEKGKNAVYEMAEIIKRVEKVNNNLMKNEKNSGTLVLSEIKSKAVSLNAVPFECEIHLDRRLVLGEDEALISLELEKIIEGKEAQWEIATINKKSWTGFDIEYKPFHMPWTIDKNHELTQATIKAYEELIGKEPEYDFWDFSTNAVTPVSMDIPTIGFGPGDYKLAHMTNERCAIDEILEACNVYTGIIKNI